MTLPFCFKEYEFFITGWQSVFTENSGFVATSAVELCCGVFPKVGLALDSLVTAQDIYYVDVSAEALKKCAAAVSQCAKNSQSYFFASQLSEVNLINSATLVCGNHLLDDILIRQYLQETGDIDQDPYQSKTIFLSLTQKVLLYYQNNLDDMANRLAGDIDRLMLPQGRFIFSEYVSYYEKDYGLTAWPEFRLRFIERLAQAFLALHYKSITIKKLPLIFDKVVCWEKPC